MSRRQRHDWKRLRDDLIVAGSAKQGREKHHGHPQIPTSIDPANQLQRIKQAAAQHKTRKQGNTT